MEAYSLHKQLDALLQLNEIIYMNDERTDFLYATPTFLSGAATVFAVSGFSPQYNRSSSEIEADSIAIYSDWALAGQDIHYAATALEGKSLESKSSK